tara:strand:- start:228 stop:536 length:309 start_codon:yes stop_codon:yes gene_type:complete
MDNKQYINETLQKLIDAGKMAIETLISDVEKPISDEVLDEKRKNALDSKKKAFLDAQEILEGIVKIEDQLSKEESYLDQLNESKKDFQQGFVEKMAKNNGVR